MPPRRKWHPTVHSGKLNSFFTKRKTYFYAPVHKIWWQTAMPVPVNSEALSFLRLCDGTTNSSDSHGGALGQLLIWYLYSACCHHFGILPGTLGMQTLYHLFLWVIFLRPLSLLSDKWWTTLASTCSLFNTCIKLAMVKECAADYHLIIALSAIIFS